MTRFHRRTGLALATALAGIAWPAIAAAQAAGDDLMALGKGQLRTELQSRHDGAIQAMAATVAANDPRYIWASEAKAQCGIALGWLKSGTKDALSIGKCADAYARMQSVAMAPAPLPPVSTITPEACRQAIAGTVFFDWNSATPPADSAQTINYVASNMRPCGWTGLALVGHADRSGSDGYNQALSVRRADAIAAMLTAAGVAMSSLSVSGRGESDPRVPTADGVRELQNRRVEITVK
jgi:outer membrane protein OmpA-like peptidoglycan-associated protein